MKHRVCAPGQVHTLIQPFESTKSIISLVATGSHTFKTRNGLLAVRPAVPDLERAGHREFRTKTAQISRRVPRTQRDASVLVVLGSSLSIIAPAARQRCHRYVSGHAPLERAQKVCPDFADTSKRQDIDTSAQHSSCSCFDRNIAKFLGYCSSREGTACVLARKRDRPPIRSMSTC